MMWRRIRGQMGLAEALASCRAQAGLTQAELAERLKVDRTTVVRMEAGTPRALARVVAAFSVAGYDLVAVPRDARLVVTAAQPAQSD